MAHLAWCATEYQLSGAPSATEYQLSGAHQARGATESLISVAHMARCATETQGGGGLKFEKNNSVAHQPGAPQKVDGVPQFFFSNPTPLWIAFLVLQEENKNDKDFKK